MCGSVQRWNTCCPAFWMKIDWKSHNVTVNAHTSSMNWNQWVWKWFLILAIHFLIASLLQCFFFLEHWKQHTQKKRVCFLGLISHAINSIHRRHRVENVRKIEKWFDTNWSWSNKMILSMIVFYFFLLSVYDDVKMNEFCNGNETQQT